MIDDPIIASQTPAADFTINQVWEAYTEEEHAVWDLLYKRQSDLLPGRTTSEFLEGLEMLSLSEGGIPDLKILNPKLMALTGWTVIMVPHLVPDDVFFDHLANRRFPAGRFIRKREQLDYLQEPDIFHDIFGHVPLLTQPIFADYMQAYGRGGLRSLKYNTLKNLARLYWYTVEFGLIQTDQGLRHYGAGIVSSYGEAQYSLESDSPHRLGFDLLRVMQTDYKIDDYQDCYFVIQSFDELFEATQQDFGPLYERLSSSDIRHTPQTVLETDTVIHKGALTYGR
jgi:phenylalanine-4-hydroxylase